MIDPLYVKSLEYWCKGLAIHWLHEKQKRPVESGWTTGPRKDWKYLNETYVKGFNVGVRLGTPSKLGNGYLAVVDVDVKSAEKQHRVEALHAARQLLGELSGLCPVVASGRGNGSCHYYCVTERPFKTWNPAVSADQVKVHMPSKKPSKAELQALTPKEIGEGIRIANAWEISLYSDGRQVVLPPSIHPDSGKPYVWEKPWLENMVLPLVQFPTPTAAPGDEMTKSRVVKNLKNEVLDDVKFTKIDLGWLPISDEVRDAITLGSGVGDRSGYLIIATNALRSAGLSRDEILSVLTDTETFLGACAYDHAKTKSRKKASDWLWKYTVEKVLTERDASNVFKPVTDEKPVLLSDEARLVQDKAVESDRSWKEDIVRSGKNGEGIPRPTLENVVLILTNAVSPELAKRNLFAVRDTYGCDVPWGGKVDELLGDDDVIEIKHWLSAHWGFEPKNNIIYEALILIARKNCYDPVCDWLDSLPEWDGNPRLDSWLIKYFEAEGDPEYNAQVFTKWLVAMVMRAKHPGSKFDWFPVFEGKQGVGKSSFGRLLVGEKVFLDSLPNLADKDAALSLQGIWGVEMGELANMRRTEIEVVKAFITRTVDKVRAPYGKRWMESPRRCVFFGTTNRSTYLTDDTGNRRIKPLMVGKLNFKALKRDREQLFAEALTIYNELFDFNDGLERYFELTGQARIFEAEIQGEKMVGDESSVMVELLQEFIEKVDKNEVKFDFTKFRISDLFGTGTARMSGYPLNKRNIDFMAKAVKKLGGEKWKSDGLIYWKVTKRDSSAESYPSPDFY